nr:hypothetical protein [Bacteroidota bacterium]
MKNQNRLPGKKKNPERDEKINKENSKAEAMIKKMKLQNDALEKILQTLNSFPEPDIDESEHA